MALKLLNPVAAATQAKNKRESDNARVVEIQELIAQKLRELATAEASYDDALQRQRNQWAAEQMEHQNKVLEKEQEVEALEERRKAALVPLTVREQEIENVANALALREQKAGEREHDLDEQSSALEERLDEVAERELRVADHEQSLQLQADGVKRQAQDVQRGSELLTVAVTRAQAEAVSRETDLTKREMALNAKENSLEERERIVQVKEDGFTTREVKIADDRATLERAIAESKQKYGIR